MSLRIILIVCLSFFILLATAQKTESIKIGLLIQDKVSLAAKQGAELAIKTANKKEGFNGCSFQLITKDMEGPWGTGSKQAVKLVFEDKVWALLGSHDGRNAHLVEQAATKSTVVFVSAWSSDPTLSQAFIPWFFNCVPNDYQQAKALIEEIYNKRKITKVAIIIDNTYESNLALKNFLLSLKSTGKNEPVQLIFDNYASHLDALTDQIIKTEINCIVLFCRPIASLKVIRLIRQRKMSQPVFGSLSILNENELSEQELQEFDDIMLVPSGTWSGSKSLAFQQEYQKTYGEMPGMVAAYAFDGMTLLIEAIKTAGVSEREKIQDALSKIHYEGVTGVIHFDDKGNRLSAADLVEVKKGVPVAVGSK